MKEEAFHTFLKRGGRSPNAIQRVIGYVREFEVFLSEQCNDKRLWEAELEDLDDFVNWIEREPKASAKGHLWGLAYYFEHTSKEEMRELAADLRGQLIQRTPFLLKNFRGVNLNHVEKLAAAKIKNINQMLKRGATPKEREELANRTGIPIVAIVELVKLSDLARIPGVKGIRARLYVDAGVDTVEKMARWDPAELIEMIRDFVERTGFEGVPTLAAEARYTIHKAKKLPIIVTFE